MHEESKRKKNFINLNLNCLKVEKKQPVQNSSEVVKFTEYFSVFAKNFFAPKQKTNLIISFVMKKMKCQKKQNTKKIKSNCSKIIEKKRQLIRIILI